MFSSRLELIKIINPTWGQEIENFVVINNEFIPYLDIISINDKPLELKEINNLFEDILYCMCSCGVNAKFGYNLYLKVKQFLNINYPCQDFDFKISETKRKYIKSLIDNLLENNIKPDEMTFDLFIKHKLQKIKGIGETTLSIIFSKYNDDWSILPLTDRNVISSIKKVYGVNIKSKKEIKNISKTWSNPKVAVAFLRNIYNYT